MSWLPFFVWLNDTAVSTAIRDSLWLFPFVEAVHLLALALLGGTVLIVDLRLLGAGLRGQPTAQVAADVRPWMLASLAVILGTGALMFASQALRYRGNVPLALKLVALALVLLFTFTVKQRVIRRADERGARRAGQAVAVVSLSLWTAVGVMGRGIGFW